MTTPAEVRAAATVNLAECNLESLLRDLIAAHGLAAVWAAFEAAKAVR